LAQRGPEGKSPSFVVDLSLRKKKIQKVLETVVQSVRASEKKKSEKPPLATLSRRPGQCIEGEQHSHLEKEASLSQKEECRRKVNRECYLRKEFIHSVSTCLTFQSSRMKPMSSQNAQCTNGNALGHHVCHVPCPCNPLEICPQGMHLLNTLVVEGAGVHVDNHTDLFEARPSHCLHKGNNAVKLL